MYALKELTKLIGTAFAWAGMWAWKLVTAPFLVLWWFVKSLALAIAATPMILFRLPVRGYRRLMRFRDWALVKIEFLQAESAKWKTTFTIVKSPFTLLTKMGFSPQMATSLLIGASAVGGGVVVNETVFAEKSFARSDTGIYEAGVDIPSFWSPEYNTLRVDLGSIPIKNLEINSVSIGTAYGGTLPSGQTTAISIGGNSSLNTPTFLLIGELIFSKNRCETLTVTNVKAHTLNVISNISDGHSYSAVAGNIRPRSVIAGGGGMSDFKTENGQYDRIWISAPTSGVNGHIDQLTVNQAYTGGGDCLLTDLKGGTLTISEKVIGGDSNLATKATQIATSVSATVLNYESNYEEAMAVPATQTFDN